MIYLPLDPKVTGDKLFATEWNDLRSNFLTAEDLFRIQETSITGLNIVAPSDVLTTHPSTEQIATLPTGWGEMACIGWATVNFSQNSVFIQYRIVVDVNNGADVGAPHRLANEIPPPRVPSAYTGLAKIARDGYTSDVTLNVAQLALDGDVAINDVYWTIQKVRTG